MGALLALPTAARAAPITVTYEVTGGHFQSVESRDLVSGTIVVTFPNPGSGLPPLSTTGHSIYYRFTDEFGYTRNSHLTSARSPVRMAFRGAHQTLRALLQRTSFRDCHGLPPSPTNCEHRAYDRFEFGADRYGNILGGFFGYEPTAEGTTYAWVAIRGHEVVSTPEPTSGSLLVLAGAGFAGAGAAVRRLARRAT